MDGSKAGVPGRAWADLSVSAVVAGYGRAQSCSDLHGEGLGEEELKLTKENLGWPHDPRFPDALTGPLTVIR